MIRSYVALALLLVLAPVARPEVVTLKSGEKVRGRIVSRDGGTLVIDAPEKRWEIPLDKVAHVEERAPLLREFHSHTGLLSDTDADGFFTLALWCREKGLFETGDDVMAWVIGIDTDHAHARASLGFFRARNGQWVKGKASAEGSGTDDLFEKALKHYRKGEDPKAIEVLKKILAEAPGHADALYILGDIYYTTGKLGHAEREFKALVKEAPESPWGHYGISLVALRQKKYADAAARARQALAKSKDVSPTTCRKIAEAEFHYILGLTYRGRLASGGSQSEKEFLECVKRDRKHFRAWTELGIIAGNKGKFRDAFSAFSKALSFEKTYIPARYNWGVALYRSGNQKDAIMKLMPLTRHPTFYVESLKIIGRCYHRFGDVSRARNYYSQYVDKGGKDDKVRQWLRDLKN